MATSKSVRSGPETAGRNVILVLVVTALYLLYLIVFPFWKSLFLGAVLAGALYPWYERLAARLGDRRQIAASLVTLGVVLILVVPTLLMTFSAAREVVDGVKYVRETLQSEGVSGLVNDLPPTLRSLGRKVLDQIPKEDEQQLSNVQGAQAAAAVGGVLSALSNAVIQTAMMLIAFFFLLTDGPALVAWVSENAPLPASHVRGLLTEFRQVSVSVLVSSSATALVQSLIAVVGYLIAGVPQPFFFFMVTFVMAFVPAVGGGGMSVILAVFLLLKGHTGSAIFLLLWGLIAVGLSDNVLKPLLMRGDVRLHGAVIFFALLGGLAYFGMVGLIAGPLIVVFFLAVVRMYRREYKEPTPVVEEATPAAE